MKNGTKITTFTGDQLAAARRLARIEQVELAQMAGKDKAGKGRLSVPTIKRFEAQSSKVVVAREKTLLAIVAALGKAGVELIPENGGGAGVRLAKRSKRGAK